MSDTPKTDAEVERAKFTGYAIHCEVVAAETSRILERELTAEKQRSERLKKALREVLGLVRGAQDQMSLYIQPDGDADTTLDNLLYLLDGPKQREVEARARAALGDSNG